MNRDKKVITIAAFIISLTMGVIANLLFMGIGWWSMLVYALGGTYLFNRVYTEVKEKDSNIEFEPIIVIEDEDPMGVEAGIVYTKTNPTKH